MGALFPFIIGCRSNHSAIATDLNSRALAATEFPAKAGGYSLRAWEIVPAGSRRGSEGSVTAHYGTEGGVVHASVTQVSIPPTVTPESWISHDRLLVALKSASPSAEPTERGTLRYGSALVVYLRYHVTSEDSAVATIRGCLATTFADPKGRAAYLLRAQSSVTDSPDAPTDLDPQTLLAPLLRALL